MQAAVRPASVSDIAAMHLVRLEVRENQLSEEASITEESYLPFVTKGDASVAQLEGQVVGFAALDAAAKTVWALFVSPGAEKLGIGKALHDIMMESARQCGLRQLTLFTSPGTRAERFYTAAGWLKDGLSSAGDVRFRRQLRH